LKQGGIRVPHLHYKGELYLLNKKQWNEFSGEILKEFSKKLAETKTVNFGQLMDLSETMNEII
jgi:transposase